MTKDISTLIPDIYTLIQRKDGWFDEQLSNTLSGNLSTRLRGHFNEDPQKSTLRLSKMGPQCPKALWYSIKHPELAEALPPWAEIKFAYGHVLEALAIALAKAAGHTVTGEQDAVSLDGIVGHRDCVMDGCVVDVKSASSRGFQKFKSKSFYQMDSFGYLDQLDGYVVASFNDPLVTVKDKGYILAIDKVLGHMLLYEHTVRPDSIRNRIKTYKDVVSRTSYPACTCGTRPHGASGNIQLDMKASYSPYKHCCFPGLRVFKYSDGPVFLTRVVNKPDVPEIFYKKQIREEHS